MPHGWGANLLMYNTNKVSPAPTPGRRSSTTPPSTQGKVTAYDSPIYIADAALYLMAHQAGPGHQEPLRARPGAARRRRRPAEEAAAPNVGEYWSDYTQGGPGLQGRQHGGRHHLAGDREHRHGRDAPVKAFLPEGGLHRLVRHLDGGAKTKHPNCAYRWLELHRLARRPTPRWRSTSARRPANLKACQHDHGQELLRDYHAADAAYAEKIWYWTTPIKQCLDGRTSVNCTDYAAWTKAWQRSRAEP